MDLLEDNITNPLAHWYYKVKFFALEQAFENCHNHIKKVADIGAGSAIFSKELSRRHPEILFQAIDINYTDSEISQSQGNLVFSRIIEKSDFYILTDVLEHVSDDEEFLGKIVSNASPDSVFFITVPAFQLLWSGHDVFLKHFRRYRKNQLEDVLKASGLRVLETRYLYCFLFLPALFMRKFYGKKEKSQLHNSSELTNSILNILNKMERVFIKQPPFGISLMMIATKQSR